MSQPQILRNDSLGFLPNHSSYGIVSTDLDGALFRVNAGVSNAKPQNDSGKLIREIIDRIISNKVRLQRSDTPLRCGVPGGVSCELFRIVSNVHQTRNSNILLHDQIIGILFSCYDDFQLHSEIL